MVIYHLYKLPQVTINNEKVLLHDGEVFDIDGIRIECFLVPGHTWGHMVFLIDDKYLFTGDTLWFGCSPRFFSFFSSKAKDFTASLLSSASEEIKLYPPSAPNQRVSPVKRYFPSTRYTMCPHV